MGLPCPGLRSASPALQADSLLQNHQGSPWQPLAGVTGPRGEPSPFRPGAPTACSTLRPSAEPEPALSIPVAPGDTQGGSLVCRAELTSGIKLGDQPASQPQPHIGTNQNCSNVGVLRSPSPRLWAGWFRTHPPMSPVCTRPRAELYLGHHLLCGCDTFRATQPSSDKVCAHSNGRSNLRHRDSVLPRHLSSSAGL